MNEILDTILKDTYTLTLLRHRLRILKTKLLQNFFGSEVPFEQPSTADLNWLNSLPSVFYQQFNKDNVYQIFEAIEAKVNNTPILLVYIPFEASDQAIYQIGFYLRKNFANFYLFETKFDPELIAGCALSWKGIYRNYSLKIKIEEKKEEVLKSFKKFLR